MNPVLRADRCPFCGGNGSFGTAVVRHRGRLMERAFIGCKRCKITRFFDAITLALSWWNTRA
jgi:predicted nucleic-acid-binding Zn-ribbon protein